MIGIKSSLDHTQLQNKLSVRPELVEFHITDDDMKTIDEKILWFHKNYPSLKVVFHCPFLFEKKRYCDICEEKGFSYIMQLLKMCEKYDFCHGVVVHPESEFSEIKYTFDLFTNQWSKIPSHLKKFAYLENLVGNLTQNKDDFLKLLKENNVKSVTFDMTHFSANHSQDDLEKTMKFLFENYNLYVHISDHVPKDWNPIALNIGQGNINFKPLLSYLTFATIETHSQSEQIGTEMKEDYKKIMELLSSD